MNWTHILAWALGVASFRAVRYVFVFYKAMFGLGSPSDEIEIDRPLFSFRKKNLDDNS